MAGAPSAPPGRWSADSPRSPPEPMPSAGINFTRWAMDRADHREGKRHPLLKTLDAMGLGFDS